MSAIVLPDVFQATLTPEDARAPLADIAFGGESVAVTLKQAREGHVAPESRGIERARVALDEPSVRGIQLRYVHRDIEWLDTLLRTPAGWRLTRIVAPGDGSAHA